MAGNPEKPQDAEGRDPAPSSHRAILALLVLLINICAIGALPIALWLAVR